MGAEAPNVGTLMGCNFEFPVDEGVKAAAPHTGFCEYYRTGSGNCTCGAAMSLCGKDVVRAGKCEQHKVERRKNVYSERRVAGSSDTPPSCGNPACRVTYGETFHNLLCPDRGPGWA
jgi:hypothetical protein